MNDAIDVQLVVDEHAVPDRPKITSWVDYALKAVNQQAANITVRVVSEDEMLDLNHRFRGCDSTTNVLSFPSDGDSGHDPGICGDIAVCAAVVRSEAGEQNKPIDAHWAHMIVHGVLHLCGHDHMDDAEAADMESLEARVLGQLGFSDPYGSG